MGQDTRKLRVGIVADWTHCSREVSWLDALKEVECLPQAPSIEYTEYRLADRVVRGNVILAGQEISGTGTMQPKQGFFIQDCDVLVINWDAVNGDPDFGADFALRWFEHRHPEILIWVSQGGVLIIEGQATLSVPTQKAYDALLGPSELRVCGAEDELNPLAQLKRQGTQCRMTATVRDSQLFFGLDEITCNSSQPYEKMFPQDAGLVLVSYFKAAKPRWDHIYRGWFCWSPFAKKRLPWVSLIKTKDRWINRSVMQVAKHGRGAIVASTMFLASTRQVPLINALLRCHNNINQLPSPSSVSRFLQQNASKICGALAGVLAGILYTGTDQTIIAITRVGLVIGIGCVLSIIPWVPQFLKKFARWIFGW